MAATTTERRRPSAVWILAGSLALFFAVLGFLAAQVRAGGDPALGPAKPATSAEPRRVIVHRVIVRRVIVTERAPRVAAGGEPAVAAGGTAAGEGSSVAADGTAAGGGSAVAAGDHGGGSAGPAPAAPAASAPASPAPVTTGAS